MRTAVLAFGNLGICTNEASVQLALPTAGLEKVQQFVPRKVQVKIKPENWRQTWKVSRVYSNLEPVAILLTF